MKKNDLDTLTSLLREYTDHNLKLFKQTGDLTYVNLADKANVVLRGIHENATTITNSDELWEKGPRL